jgi:hypothetical protein
MVTDYVTDASAWKRWQQEYQFGVLLIIPPDPPLAQVNALRARYAWSQTSECPAHISLTIPLPRPLTSTDWEALAMIAAAIPSFDIHYGPLQHYLPHPGVCLAISPQAQLASLCAALETAACFTGAQPRRYPFSAQMTIAEIITVEQTASIMVELANEVPRGTFRCTDVTYAVPDGEFRFTERGRLALAR